MLPAAVTSVTMPLESTVGLKCARSNQFALRLLNLSAVPAGLDTLQIYGEPHFQLHFTCDWVTWEACEERGLRQVNSLLKAARNGCNLKQQAEEEKGEERGKTSHNSHEINWPDSVRSSAYD